MKTFMRTGYIVTCEEKAGQGCCYTFFPAADKPVRIENVAVAKPGESNLDPLPGSLFRLVFQKIKSCLNGKA